MKTINQNEKYIEYLNTKNISQEDLLEFIKKMSNIDYPLIFMSIYLSLLIEILVIYFIFKIRLSLFGIAFFIYAFINLNIFSEGIFSSLFYPSLQKFLEWYYRGSFYLEYNDYVTLINQIMPAMKEALLTFIIIDVVGQFFTDKREKKSRQKLRFILRSMENMIEYLNTNSIKNVKVKKAKVVDFNFLLHFSRKYKHDKKLNELTILLKSKQSFIKGSHSLELTDFVIFLELCHKNLSESKAVSDFLEY